MLGRHPKLSIPADFDRRVRDPQRVRDRGHHRWEHLPLGQRGLQPATEEGQRSVRLIAVAVQQPVHQPLQAVPQRREDDRDRTGGHHGGCDRLEWPR
jgi:hypothetical protein